MIPIDGTSARAYVQIMTTFITRDLIHDSVAGIYEHRNAAVEGMATSSSELDVGPTGDVDVAGQLGLVATDWTGWLDQQSQSAGLIAKYINDLGEIYFNYDRAAAAEAPRITRGI